MPKEKSVWPGGEAEMAWRIRECDWSRTPLGPIEAWPPELKTAIGIMLASALPMGLYWGPELILLYNDAWRELMGDQHPSALGQPTEAVYRKIWPEFSPYLQRAARGEGSIEIEEARLPLDRGGAAKDAWFNITFDIVPLADATVGGILNVAKEVTARVEDRRRREEADRQLHENARRFRALVTAGAYSIYRMSPDWRVLYSVTGNNPADSAETIENWAERYLLTEDRAEVLARIEEAIRTKSLFEMEHRLRMPDGAIGWVLSRAVPILDEDGEIIEWFGAGSDITERRASVEGLRASEERHRTELEQRIAAATAELKASRDLLQATMDASTDMIQVFEAIRDEEGRIIDFNWVLNNHTSESRYGEVRGESLLTRNPGVLEEDIFESFRRVTETGIPEQAEHHYVHEQFDGWFYQSVVKLNDGVATTTKEISEWKRAQADLLRLQEETSAAVLREKDEFQQLILASALDYAIFTIDENGFVTSWPPGAQAVFGWSEAEMLGRDFAITFTPKDRAADQPRQERETAARTGVAPNVRWHLHKDGRRIFIEGSTRPLQQGGQSRPSGFIKIGQDVTARRQAERSLRENRRRLQTMIEGIPQLVWRSGSDKQWTWASPQWSTYTGLSEEESLGFGWLNALHPDDRDEAMASWDRADGSSTLDMEARLLHVGEGQYRWFQTRALPVRDEDGAILEWLGTSTDIDDLRQLQNRQEVLLAELQHRTRNLISVVRGISDKTAATSNSLAEFSQRFRDRLSALSRINTLLSKLGQGERITFDEMIRTEFGARGVLESDKAERVVLEGPEGIRLRSATVQTFALAIHELTTNAVKYGALSNGRGELRVSWRVVEDEAGRQRLMVEWIETGIAAKPDAGEAPQGSGYGRELIERALPYQLRAKTSYELGQGGVRCTIELPLG